MYSSAILLLLLTVIKIQSSQSEEPGGNFFLNAAKSVPRIGRNSNKNNNNNNADFEKFFLKASKSVPRIGRRNELDNNADDYDLSDIAPSRIPYIRWSEIADRFAYEPELFSSPEFIARINQEMASDDPSVYEWDKVRIKRTIPARFMKLHQKQFY